MKLGFALLCISVLSQTSFGLTTYPFHCRSVEAKELLQLDKSRASQLMVIENISNNSVWLVNQSDGAGVDAGFDSEVRVEQSSALLFNGKRKLSFQCIESKDGSEQIFPCSDLIKVCRATRFNVDPEFTGSFWAVENSTKKELSFKLSKAGIEVE